jgi:hypothetical protein
MAKTIVRMAVNPDTKGIDLDGKVPSISTYSKSGLAVVRLDLDSPWCVIHCLTGRTVCLASSKRHAIDILDAVEDLEDWVNLETPPEDLKARVDERVNNTPVPGFKRKTKLQRVVESTCWKGCVVTGPEEHTFTIKGTFENEETGSLESIDRQQTAMAYRIEKGSAVAWVLADA